MRTVEHPEEDGRQCWMTEDELTRIVEAPDKTTERIAMGLMGRCDLRKHEAVRVTPSDVVRDTTGTYLEVESAKGGRLRQPPVPDDLATTIQTYSDVADLDRDDPLVDASKRSLARWVDHHADALQSELENEQWRYVTPHDLRRSWAQALIERGVEPGMVMEWGGWESWPVFRDHYLNEFSPAALSREREKVDWL